MYYFLLKLSHWKCAYRNVKKMVLTGKDKHLFFFYLIFPNGNCCDLVCRKKIENNLNENNLCKTKRRIV